MLMPIRFESSLVMFAVPDVTVMPLKGEIVIRGGLIVRVLKSKAICGAIEAIVLSLLVVYQYQSGFLLVCQ